MSFFYKQRDSYKDAKVGNIIFVCIAVVVFFVATLMITIPKYGVWSKTLKGKAQLREQEFTKQILVEQAKAELESAKLYADAEIERARGVAESTKIISTQLQRNEAYLQYLAIQAQMKMADSPNHSVVYIPSGANGIPLIKGIK